MSDAFWLSPNLRLRWFAPKGHRHDGRSMSLVCAPHHGNPHDTLPSACMHVQSCPLP